MNKVLKAFMAAALLGGGGSLIIGIPSAHAQASVTEGSLRGVLRDKGNNNEPAAGATLVATSPALQGEQVVITDENGQYFVTALPPGIYTLTVYYNDTNYSRGNVLIQVGKEAVVNIAVDSRANAGKPKGEVINVVGNAPIIDQGSTKVGMTITEDYTRNIPTGRTFASVIGAAAGATEDYSAQGKGISFAGSEDLENTYIVEGINTTDTGYGGISTNLPTEFIAETEVISGGYNAEYGRATGGIVNVVTKQGSNTIHGSVFGYFKPGAFISAAKTIDREGSSIASRIDLDHEYDFGAEVGGPIIKDKVWFHVGFNPSFAHETETRIIQRQTDVNNRGVADVDPVTGFTKHEFVSSSAYPIDNKTYFFTAKLNGQIDQNNQWQISAFGNPSTNENVYAINRNPAFINDTNDNGAYDLAGKWTSKFNGGKTELDGVFGFHRGYTYDNTLNSSQDRPEVYYNYQRSLYDFADIEGANTIGKCQDGVGDYQKIQKCPVTGYVEQGLGYLEQGTKDRETAVVSITQRVKLAGYHVFKAGVDLELQTFNADKRYTGAQIFRRSPDTAAGAPGRWQLREFLNVDRNLTDAEQADPTSIMLKPGQHLCAANNVTGKFQAICSTAQHIAADTSDTNYGAFLQDSWQIYPNFTLNAGLRYEDQIGYAGKALQGQVTPDGEIVPAQVFNLNDLWAPRLGFIYDPTKEGRSKIFGHFGRFYETVPMDLQVREFGGEYINFSLLNSAHRTPDQKGYDPNCNIDHNGALIDVSKLASCSDVKLQTQSGGPAEYVNPQLRGQYTQEGILGAEYEVMADLKMGLTYTHRSLPSVIEDISTDGGNTYLITNPGQNFDGLGATLHQQAMTLMASSDPKQQALGNLYEHRSQQMYFTKNFDPPIRNYDALTVTATQRPTKASLLQASYTYSESKGNYPGLFSTETGQADPNITSQYDLPDLVANRYGKLGLDRPHNLKIDGFYLFDLNKLGMITTGVSFRALSGIPHNVLGESPHPGYGLGESYLLPRGTVGRSPVTTQLDVHLAYGRMLSKNNRLEGFVNIFNLTNQQDELNVDEDYTTTDAANPIPHGTMSDLKHLKTLDLNTGAELNASPNPNKNFGHTAPGGSGGPAIQAPRTVQLGIRLSF